MKIRYAEPSDTPAVQKLGRETYVEHFSTLWQPQALETYLQQEFSDEALQKQLAKDSQSCYLLAEDEDGVPQGFAKIVWNTPVSGRNLCGALLQKLYFYRRVTGRGYGSSLLAQVEELARQHQEKLLWLDVLEQNPRAQSLYLSKGFKPAGESTLSVDNMHFRLQVMVKNL